jgi:cyclophilin family peptidyl-prolyl cis-trans isomerase
MHAFHPTAVAVFAAVLAVGCSSSSPGSGQEDAGAPPQDDAAPLADDAAPGDAALADDAAPGNPVVEMITRLGTITIELFPVEAPIGVANFLSYVDAQFYDGTIVHRVIPDFVIQGGGLTTDMTRKETNDPITNEAGNGLLNERGTLACARTSVVDSATSQFFVNLAHNDNLDHVDDTTSGFGYAVFGQVLAGMDVVDAIAAVPTGTQGAYEDVPLEPVVITTARRKP